MYKSSLLFLLFFLPTFAKGTDIFLADKYFTEQKYALAKKEYLASAKVGNPHAYYQLGNMYHKGLGGEKDAVNAMLYFYLAAEQKFHNSEQIITNILESLPKENQHSILQVLEDYKKSHGIENIITQYFPVLETGDPIETIKFNGEATRKTVYHPQDIELDDYQPNTFGGDLSFDASSDEAFSDDSIELVRSTPRTPFLIIDHDIASDGSIRYTSEVQKFGHYQPLIEQFILFPIEVPMHGEQAVDFASRTYLGAAAFNKFALIRENEKMYEQVVRQTRKFRKGGTVNDQFNLAMLMLNFPWIEQENTEAEQILLRLSETGHSPAMYEYGFKLYREQRDLAQAIHWLSEASKYGLVRAEYRLAKILQTSPWVIKDEKKALFWFESAMSKGDIESHIAAVDILFNSKNKEVANYDKAVKYLLALTETANNDPRYNYLLALKYRTGANRNIKLAVENLETAILRGQMKNWDVSSWQDLLTRITTGNIFVTDYEN